MNFILTKYIFPIEDSIPLSNQFNFKLDNPRSTEEINFILDHLNVSLCSPDEAYEYDSYFRVPIHLTKETEGILTIESAIKDFKSNFSEIDMYTKSFFAKNEDCTILELLARMWIIARFDDEGESNRMKEAALEMREKGNHGFFLLDDNHPIVNNCNNLVNYSYLISLLINTDYEDYFGNSFVLNHDSHELQIPKIDRFLNQTILYFGFMAYKPEVTHEEDKWMSFYHIREDLYKTVEQLNEVTDELNKEKLLYISGLLKVANHEIRDGRIRLVTLVSIIELLLTHSPNFNRFNVEDSISKQFKLKTSIVVYQNDKTLDLNSIKNRLKVIYNQRSNISHGNFKSLDKYLQNEVKNAKKEDIDKGIILDNLSSDVYKYIRAIMEEYIKDRDQIEFLKEN